MKRRSRITIFIVVGIALSVPAILAWRQVTLARLQSCRGEMPTDGEQYFESPCQKLGWRLLPLAGVSIETLQSHLGEPNYCFDYDPVTDRPLHHATCYQPAWSFYYLPPHSLGGGLNLVCSSGDGKTCRWLYWLGTA